MNYVSVHGFNSWRGKTTTDKCKPIVVAHGSEYEEFNYKGGRAGVLPGLLITRFGGIQRAGERLIEQINRGGKPVVLIVHSNGLSVAAVAMELMERLPKDEWLIKGVISFSGCLRGDWGFPEGVVVLNNYCPRDWTLKIGAELRHDILRHPMWGDMGARPYRGPNQLVIDVECGKDVNSHSEWFKDAVIKSYVLDSLVRIEGILNSDKEGHP